jgi:hypothetical protein
MKYNGAFVCVISINSIKSKNTNLKKRFGFAAFRLTPVANECDYQKFQQFQAAANKNTTFRKKKEEALAD